MKVRLSCLINLEPGLSCPETVTYIVENTLNHIAAGCCEEHLSVTEDLVEDDVRRVWTLGEWLHAGREVMTP